MLEMFLSELKSHFNDKCNFEIVVAPVFSYIYVFIEYSDGNYDHIIDIILNENSLEFHFNDPLISSKILYISDPKFSIDAVFELVSYALFEHKKQSDLRLTRERKLKGGVAEGKKKALRYGVRKKG